MTSWTKSGEMKSVRTPTFSCYMRANPFSKEKQIYLKQHYKRMSSLSDRPYMNHKYPELPAHYPGTWRTFTWDQVDSLVNRLYYVPIRWAQDHRRREDIREAVAKQVAGPSWNEPTSTRRRHSDRAQSAPARTTPRNNGQTPGACTAQDGDDRSFERPTRLRRNSKDAKVNRMVRITPRETAWGENVCQSSGRDVIDVGRNPTTSARSSASSTSGRDTRRRSTNGSVSRQGVRFSGANGREDNSRPDSVVSRKDGSYRIRTSTHRDDRESLSSRPQSTVSVRSHDSRKWPFQEEDVDSSVMNLLQQIHATNGLVHPTPAMVNYREKQRHKGEQPSLRDG